MQAHVLWSASQVFHNPGHEGGIYLHRSQLVTQQSWTDGVKCTGEVKEHDPHSTRWLIQVSKYPVERVDDFDVEV